MLFGFDIPVDYYLGLEEIPKPKAKPAKKKKGKSNTRGKRPDSSTYSVRLSTDSLNSTRLNFHEKSKPPVSLVKQTIVLNQMRSPSTQQMRLDIDNHLVNDKLIHLATDKRAQYDKQQADQLKK